jgi:hypothetical protein
MTCACRCCCRPVTRFTPAPGKRGRAQVYLDVSGPMNTEMPLIVALPGRLSAWIRRPF